MTALIIVPAQMVPVLHPILARVTPDMMALNAWDLTVCSEMIAPAQMELVSMQTRVYVTKDMKM